MDTNKKLIGTLAIIFFIGLTIMIVLTYKEDIKNETKQEYLYQYEDFNGNIGNSNICYETYGNLICRLDNDKRVQVKWYKRR